MRHAALALTVFAAGAWGADDHAANDAMRPGPEHAELAKEAGEWDVVTRIWWQPGAKPQETTGHATMAMVLDGHYLREDFSGELMAGQPYHAVGMFGFDRHAGAFSMSWFDTFNTAVEQMTGTSTDGGKTVDYRGEVSDPMGGGKVKLHGIVTHVDADHLTFEEFELRDGKEYKGMEIAYTRVKAEQGGKK